jgi:basic membrane protein A and related proteins
LRRVIKLAAATSVAALMLAACGSSGGGSTGTGTSASPNPSVSTVKVGMAFDVGGRGDLSYNDSAAVGLDKAVSESGIEVKELSAAPQGETDATREERLIQLAEAGYNPVIAIGFAYAPALTKVAPDYPDVSFAIVDDATLAKAPNVASLVFAEEQGSFLVGSVAAQASKTKNIGFIGGVNVPLLQKFYAGYKQGAEAIDPNVKVQVKYLTEPPDFGGFNDAAKGQTAAQGMIDNGADVLFTAAGGSNAGAFKTAKPGEDWLIGTDSDQYKIPALNAIKDIIITSMLKHVDVAVYSMIKSCIDGACLTGVHVYDLASGGVGYSKSNPAIKPYEAATDALAAKIIAGEIVVSDKA